MEPLQPLSPKQARSIREATALVNIWHGAVRSGKTIASELAFARRVSKHDGVGDIALIGRTERTLKRNIIAGDGGLIDLIGTRNVRLNEGKGEVTIYGRTGYLFSANDARAEGKLRGGTFSVIYGDEVTLWPEEVFKRALDRMSPAGSQMFATTNPDAPLHWLKREFIDRESELDLRAWHFTLRDNTALRPGYVEELSRQFTGLWRKRFVEGLWVLAEGAIWDNYDPERHELAAPPEKVEFKRYFVGVDYGTSNPFVALLIGVGSDGKRYVLDEYRHDSRTAGRQLTDAQYSSALAEWIGGHGVTPSAWYVDPSAASFILQMRRDHSWTVIEAENAVADGLRHVANMLSADQLLVVTGEDGRRCEPTRHEVVSYSWDSRAQGRGKDRPIKKADHGPDALRYALYSDALYDAGDVEQYGWVA